jgi:hypothetical protein
MMAVLITWRLKRCDPSRCMKDRTIGGGNVGEWCWDANGSDRRPLCGSWRSYADDRAVAYRDFNYYGDPDARDDGIGFRMAPVRVLQSQTNGKRRGALGGGGAGALAERSVRRDDCCLARLPLRNPCGPSLMCFLGAPKRLGCVVRLPCGAAAPPLEEMAALRAGDSRRRRSTALHGALGRWSGAFW